MLNLICLLFFAVLFGEERPWVTCCFEGQLGNQMFQVAATIAYSLDHGHEAIFPALESALGGKENHQSIFHRLNTQAPPNWGEIYTCTYCELRHQIFDPIPPMEGENFRIAGFFQSERYFAHHADVIRDLFAPTPEIVSSIQSRYGELLKHPTVAVHIRTFKPDGQNPNTAGLGGRDWDYFVQAISHFPEDHYIVIFSDQMTWTKKHFPPIAHQKIVFIEGNPRHIDLYLMSLCNHQVVSPESTFSWWAAWLNPNSDKIIIAPNTGFGAADKDTIPPSWIRI